MNNPLNILMEEAIQLINRNKNIFISSHVQPDGDSVGSILALAMAVKALDRNKNVRIVKVDDIPSDLLFLPNIEMIKEQDLNQPVDLFISLDSSDMDRLGIGKEFALKAKKIINIDHHVTNDNFGDINIISSSSGATGEIVFDLIKKMGVEIDKEIATCLYTAISMDTGSFMYSNTTYKTHLIAAELLKTGIDINDININIYQSRSIERTNLFIDSLNKLETFLDNKIGIVTVTQEMLKVHNAKMEDTEGIISFVRGIKPIEVACLLKEVDEKEVKVSLRSKKEVDVSKISSKFNGGGHIRAAGCTIYENIAVAKEMILKEILSNFR
ncbi:MAG: bifunctional oligoribonuclease/PAP phosphatase NrnA [Tissierellia bacterium]|nr:bifunctional oligoribonuclease/PAP phosphatase NrnA [Tissierellia bacterium]